MANGGVHSPLVKYVIFEKFRSDPEKDGSEVALAVDTSIHRDPVFGRLFSTFLTFFVKNRFALEDRPEQTLTKHFSSIRVQ